MFRLVVLILFGSASAISCTKTVSHDFCSEYEVLHTNPPCCESTCDYECCRVVCPQTLHYEPTCVCIEGYVRYNGDCIPKSDCPSTPSTVPPTTPSKPTPPCVTSSPKPACNTTTPAPCIETAKPPCYTTNPPSSPPKLPYVLTTPKQYGYTPPVRPSYPSPVTYVPPPPSPPYLSYPPQHYQTVSSYRPKPPCMKTTPAPCTTIKPPPCTTTTISKPVTTTTTPCPTTTTPCPTKTAPTTKPPVSCTACEELVFMQPCCEPTCDYDCSDTACPLLLVEQATCACRPGTVRYQGHCIEPSACPRSTSRYRLYVPVAAHCLKSQCAMNEVLVASPPCCEPTCDCDCDHYSCQQMLVYQPTCVCMQGYVRLDGCCVPKSHCPAPEMKPTEPPCTTAAPVYHPPPCECGHKPCQCVEPVHYPAPVHKPCETTPAPCHPVYEKPSCGCGQTPCQCPVYHPAPVHKPCETTPHKTTPPPCHPVHEKPSCGCGQTPCQCVQPVYHPAPVHKPCETTPKPETPSCGCGHTPCQCVQPVYHPVPKYHPASEEKPCETTAKPTPAPTCAACEELVFVQPCCEPTCDNDCSGVQCSPLLLVQEQPTCACRPGLVRYQGHCVEPTACPKSASRYRLYVPKTVSCACNSAILLLLVAGGTHCGTITAVNYGEPEKNMCSPYEVLKQSEPCCEPTCEDDCLHAICRRTPDSVPSPTCVCRQGYVRHDGSCIRKESCPPRNPVTYDSYRPQKHHYYRTTPRTNHLPKSCGLNEKLTHCRPSCEPTCEKDCAGVKHPQVCTPETCCVCKDGYVRHNGRCIKRCDCPKRPPFLSGRPLSGEYIDFEVVSLEGLKSEEDFGYKPKAEFHVKKPRLPAYEHRKSNGMAPLYVRTLTSGASSSAQASSYEHGAHTTERPALYPPLCACHATKKMHAPAHLPPVMQDTPSYESTEEDSDIVPYAPLPTVGMYRKSPAKSLFPPPSTTTSNGPFYMPRRTILPPPQAPVHRSDLNEPLDHFFGSGQHSSAAQEEQPKKTPTIWPPVSKHCTRCGCRRH
uniref:EGF-like domain-containing protein n=1 Tax=Anopheles christyi TaxID=43041 RepID=A0A182K3P5_9DIPT